MKIPCEFCGKSCSKGSALQYHIYRKHQYEIREKLRLSLMFNHPEIYFDIAPRQITETSVTPCWICGGDREIIGPLGESLEPCPHCVLKINCATTPVAAWINS